MAEDITHQNIKIQCQISANLKMEYRMNKQEFGKSTWDEETSNKRAGNRGAERAAFMRLENGSNVVRVITDPHVYLSHKYKDEADTSTNSFGEKIMCSAPLHKSCVLCDNKNQPKSVGL